MYQTTNDERWAKATTRVITDAEMNNASIRIGQNMMFQGLNQDLKELNQLVDMDEDKIKCVQLGMRMVFNYIEDAQLELISKEDQGSLNPTHESHDYHLGFAWDSYIASINS
jgi:hypothetical protein